ncbi:hypothetical protein GMDG_05445 [Pseudogymnoascus destructans 20631-21]|uniref:Uncharacterized protein n=1 Tax=Pseudogymnoascus destructans (strain ATCC MYA-4855 / 20631-21) TaxID=658429 RepID=L8FPA6_PSED2|nr:hypothetical protein GMDG_05445 [Pseudogymnoascus destructans 20631-21]
MDTLCAVRVAVYISLSHPSRQLQDTIHCVFPPEDTSEAAGAQQAHGANIVSLSADLLICARTYRVFSPPLPQRNNPSPTSPLPPHHTTSPSYSTTSPANLRRCL